MVKNFVKVDNIFCYSILITGASGYISMMFYISVDMALFIGNAPLKFYLRDNFLYQYIFSLMALASQYAFSTLLSFLDIQQIFIFNCF